MSSYNYNGQLFTVNAPLDLVKNEIRNAVLQNLGTAPATPSVGQIYADTSSAANTAIKVYLNVGSTPQWVGLSTSSSSILGGGSTNQLAYFSSTNTLAGISSQNYGVVITNGSGVPSELAGAAGVLVGSASAIPAWSTALTGLTYNGLTITNTTGTLTVANNASAVISFSGNFAQTFTATAASTVTMPASTSAVMNYYTSAPTQYGLPYAGAASGLLSYLAVPGSLSVLTGNTGGAPSWVAATGTGSPVLGTSPSISGAQLSGTAAITGGTTTVNSGATINVASGGSLTIASGATFTSATTPTNATDVVNKQYVDMVSQGFNPKPTARVATTQSFTAMTGTIPTYNNGTSGSGATLTNAGTKAALTIDGVALGVNDIVLVKDEANATNGLYTVTTVGSGTVNWVLTRQVNMDISSEYVGGYVVIDSEGTGNKNTIWLCTNATAPTVGTTTITFVQLNGATDLVQGTGISISGNTISLASGVITAGGPTGSSTVVPVITYDTYGRLTAVSTANITLSGLGYTTSGSGTVLALTNSPVFTTPSLGAATATSINGATITSTTGGTLTLANNSTLATSGAFSTTLSASASTTLTLPGASGTLTYYVSGNAPAAANQVAYSAAASGSLAYTTVNATATNYFLRQVSSGAPAFAALASGDITTALGYTPVKKYSTTFTGAGPTWTITHNLNTTAVQVSVYDNNGNLQLVDVQAATANTVVLSYGSNVPGANTYTVVVMG